ncbi:hypothetical protein [Sorangium sp. So ce590]|uniref:hypothetical protein n=1 Tax=unclassified Sorangium TaxID=2621164 RepID=UPI003F60E168
MGDAFEAFGNSNVNKLPIDQPFDAAKWQDGDIPTLDQVGSCFEPKRRSQKVWAPELFETASDVPGPRARGVLLFIPDELLQQCIVEASGLDRRDHQGGDRCGGGAPAGAGPIDR